MANAWAQSNGEQAREPFPRSVANTRKRFSAAGHLTQGDLNVLGASFGLYSFRVYWEGTGPTGTVEEGGDGSSPRPVAGLRPAFSLGPLVLCQEPLICSCWGGPQAFVECPQKEDLSRYVSTIRLRPTRCPGSSSGSRGHSHSHWPGL